LVDIAPYLLYDVPLFGGLDDMRLSKNTLHTAQESMAKEWGTAHARFLTSGTTVANITALTVAKLLGHDEAYVSRTCHKSVLNGLIQLRIAPHWLEPRIDPETHLPQAHSQHDFEAIQKVNKPLVVLTAPGYYGELPDIRRLISQVFPSDSILIVDQAWGAHFSFGPPLPLPATRLGATITTTSLHKTSLGFSQASALLASATIDDALLDKAMDLLHTTSPSGAIVASIDLSVQASRQIGACLAERAIQNAAYLRSRLEDLFPGIVYTPRRTSLSDPTKIILLTARIQRDGQEIQSHLAASGLETEAAYAQFMLPVVTWADTSSDIDRFVRAFAKAVDRSPEAKVPPLPTSLYQSREAKMSPSDAYFAPSVRRSMDASAGHTAGEVITSYPPGVPLLVPGEVVTSEVISAVHDAQRAGARLGSISDPTGTTILTVK
jgi:lysine decarboxylase